MSLDGLHLSLLPRPARSLLSTGSELTRATLPNFANVDELGQFMHRIFNPHLTGSRFQVELKVAASIYIVGVVLVLLVLARRRYEGKLLLFRIVRKPRGILIVPNTMIAFPFTEGMLAILLSTYLLLVCKHQSDGTGLPSNFLLWITLMWLTVLFGIIWAMVGTYFAIPDARQSQRGDGEDQSVLQEFFSHPIVVNLTSTLVPTLISSTEAIPAFIGNHRWNKAHRLEREWQIKYATLPEFNTEMVQASQTIWFEAVQAMKYISGAFFSLVVIAFVLGSVYTYISYRLIKTIHADLRKTVSQDSSLKRNSNGLTLSIIIQSAVEALKDVKIAEKVEEVGNLTPPHSAAQSSLGKTMPTATKREAELSRQASNEKEKKELRLALIHIYIQVLAIAPGAFALGILALSCALTFYGKIEQPSPDGGNQFEYAYSVILLTSSWLIVALGIQTLLAIAFRTYEPVFRTRSNSHGQNGIGLAEGKGIRVDNHIQSTFFETHTRKAPTHLSLIEEGTSYGGEVSQEYSEPYYYSDESFKLLKSSSRKALCDIEPGSNVSNDVFFVGKDGKRT